MFLGVSSRSCSKEICRKSDDQYKPINPVLSGRIDARMNHIARDSVEEGIGPGRHWIR
jgi:hypothetical protein